MRQDIRYPSEGTMKSIAFFISICLMISLATIFSTFMLDVSAFFGNGIDFRDNPLTTIYLLQMNLLSVIGLYFTLSVYEEFHKI